MSHKDIRELRKGGKLKEAYAMAKETLAEDPDDVWSKRSIAWVYYEFLKQNCAPEKALAFMKCLQQIQELNLPEDEHMIFDNCAFQIGKLLFAMNKNGKISATFADELFAVIRTFHFTKPSDGYSFLFKAFQKLHTDWEGYLDFADWWDFKNFRPEDYKKESFDKREIMSIAEQAYIAYPKKLLAGKETIVADTFVTRDLDVEKIETFLPDLDRVITEHPDFQFTELSKAKLLLAIGGKEKGLEAFIPFAKEKKNNFWVWQMLGDINSENSELKFACYCKALSLFTPESFLVKIRQELAKMLLDKELFDEAKFEIEKSIQARTAEGWPIKAWLSNQTTQTWWSAAKAPKNNATLYAKYLQPAENLLYEDVPEELVAIDFINHDRSIINFVKNKQKHGHFKFDKSLKKPQIGDLLTVRFNGEPQGSFYKVLSAKPAPADAESEAIKKVEHTFLQKAANKFGFIGDVFVEPKLVETHQLEDGKKAACRAILSFNKKKEQWGWKAFDIFHENE